MTTLVRTLAFTFCAPLALPALANPDVALPVLYDCAAPIDTMVAMRDGVRLATDVYRPSHATAVVDGRWPVILMRTPYDKRVRAQGLGDIFVRRGYVLVVQDVRDRYHSGGTVETVARRPARLRYDTANLDPQTAVGKRKDRYNGNILRGRNPARVGDRGGTGSRSDDPAQRHVRLRTLRRTSPRCL